MGIGNLTHCRGEKILLFLTQVVGNGLAALSYKKQQSPGNDLEPSLFVLEFQVNLSKPGPVTVRQLHQGAQPSPWGGF